uniref:Uncharacterized protein LOC105122971 isoform X3 n=1 Tax=Rhizophora mucronata TaxID=61149 RepID=A0A2P2KPR8_RHIMU
MEDMDIDDVAIIPDTPDRIAAQQVNGVQFGGQESSSSVAAQLGHFDSRGEDCFDEARPKIRWVSKHGRKIHFHPHRSPINLDEVESCDALKSSNHSQIAPVPRREAVLSDPNHEVRHSLGPRYMQKGKTVGAKIPSKSCGWTSDSNLLDLTAQDEHNHKSKMVYVHGASKAKQGAEMRDSQVSHGGGSFFNSSHIPSMIAHSTSKGKEKVDVGTLNDSGLASNHGKAIDLSCGSQLKLGCKESPMSMSITSPRVTGRKRLVRNGCISPHNIAIRAQKSAGGLHVGSNNVETDCSTTVCNGPSPLDIMKIVSEDDNCGQAKGKEVVAHCTTSKGRDSNFVHVSASGSVTNNDAADGISVATKNIPLGGWRATHNHTKKETHPPCNITGHHSGRYVENSRCFAAEKHGNRALKKNESRNVTKSACNPEDQTASTTDSSLMSGLNRISETNEAGYVTMKRQRKNGLSSRSHGECSTMVDDDSEISFIGSSQELSRSRSLGIQNLQNGTRLDPNDEIMVLSPATRSSNSHVTCSVDNDVSVARARQVEEDEILARELQEQLYQESQVVVGGEIDENVAWALQQEENALPSSSNQNYHAPFLGNSSTLHSRRRPQTRSFPNPSNRRGTQAHVPTTRASHLRNRLLVRTPRALSRDREPYPVALRGMDFEFPMGMNLDTVIFQFCMSL